MMASSSAYPSCSSSWYLDSGANNHITPNLSHLGSNYTTAFEYEGGDRIHLADGSGITISHVGNALVQNPVSHTPFLLTYLLHVPNSSQNLLSVSQFTADNKVFFEFHPTTCFVKCQATQKVLL